jgi:serine/threonine protein kinase
MCVTNIRPPQNSFGYPNKGLTKMDNASKFIFLQLCRGVLRSFVPAGELVDELVFGLKEAIAQREIERLITAIQDQLQELNYRLSSIEEAADERAVQELVQPQIPLMLRDYRSQFGEFFYKIGKLDQSCDEKILAFGERFEGGDTGHFLRETGLGIQFPHLSTDILRHLTREGELQDIYELGDEIDRGGMSRIIRARRKGHNKWIALKCFTAGERGMLERFLIEGYVGRTFLNSPYLLDITDFGGFINSGDYFIESELLCGQNLQCWIRSHPYRGPGDPHLRLVGQMIEGLQYLHAQGFIHRDIKPANFFVTEDGQVKLLDFGIIKSLRHNISDPALTRTTQSLGTPAYKAPEQIEPSQYSPVTEKADIYGLGCTLFELLTGHVPFEGSRLEIEHKHLQQSPPRPSQYNLALSPDIDALVLSCMEKDPTKRPSLNEVIELLPPPPPIEARWDLLATLSGEGFSSRDHLLTEIQQVVREECGMHKEIEAHIEHQQIQNARDRMFKNIEQHLKQNYKILKNFQEILQKIDPQTYHALCPNLLCGESRQRGIRCCPVCDTDFNSMPCPHCDKETPYSSSQCQHSRCAESIQDWHKMRFSILLTSRYALTQGEYDAARAILAISWFFRGRFRWDRDPEAAEQAEALHRYYAQYNRNFQIQVQGFRKAYRKLVQKAQNQYIKAQRKQTQETVKEIHLLVEEGRYLDAYQALQEIPAMLQNKESIQLVNRIGEKLTAEELKEAESLLVYGYIPQAIDILNALPYASVRRDTLMTKAQKYQKKLAQREEAFFSVQNLLKTKTIAMSMMLLLLLVSGVIYLSLPSHNHIPPSLSQIANPELLPDNEDTTPFAVSDEIDRDTMLGDAGIAEKHLDIPATNPDTPPCLQSNQNKILITNQTPSTSPSSTANTSK